MTTEITHLNDLLLIYYLTALIKESNYYQSQNPNCITNRETFKHCQTFETVLSDYYKLISTIKKSGIFKGLTKKKIYQSCKA